MCIYPIKRLTELTNEFVKYLQSGAFWRVISQHGVNVSFMAPTAVRAIRKEDPEGSFFYKYGMSSRLKSES